MNLDISKLRQVSPCEGGIRVEHTNGVVLVIGMTIFDFLRETKHLR